MESDIILSKSLVQFTHVVFSNNSSEIFICRGIRIESLDSVMLTIQARK